MYRIAALLFLLLAAGASAGVMAADTLKLRVAIDGNYPPFNKLSEDGQWSGFDVDFTEALCAELKADCAIIYQSWDGMIPGLLANKYDLIIASMYITDERKKLIDFSDKYYQTPMRFVRRKRSGVEITPESLRGRAAGIQRASTDDRFLTFNYGDTLRIRRYASIKEYVSDLVDGRIDLAFGDAIVLEENLLSTDAGQDFEFVGPNFTDRDYFGEGAGIALRKENQKLRQAINKAIATLRENGTYRRIQSKYFNFDIYGS